MYRCIHLSKGRLNVVVGANKAATAGSAVVGSGHGSLLRVGCAVDELVTGGADVAGETLEDAGVHVRDALGRLDGHVATLHVDLAGDIKGAELAIESEFTPSLGDLAVDQLSIVVDGGPATANSGRVGNVEAGTVLEIVGDVRLVDIDPAGSRSPDNDTDVLAAVVDELAGVVTIVAQPSGAVAGLGVGSGEYAKKADKIGNEATLLNDRSWDG